MRILPITFDSYYKINSNVRKQEINNKIDMPKDTVSFGTKLMSGKEFKKKCSKYMTCFYTNTPMT